MDAAEVKGYWERRFESGPSLDTVGWLGLGLEFNRWMYRVRARIFRARTRRALRASGVAPQSARVLDVGSGSGFYLDLWQRMGIRSVSGCDLTQASVTKLQALFPGVEMSRADIGDESTPFEPGTFDAISCMDVLFHIVDDARYERAIQTCATLLRPRGVLVFTDNFLHRDTIRIAHQASRSLHEIEDAVASAGLTIVERRPVFVLMNTPVDSQNRVLRFCWRALNAVVRRNQALGFPAGLLLYAPELFLTSVLREGPSTEMMICRR
jgi:SAM-dependent methyltransferase